MLVFFILIAFENGADGDITGEMHPLWRDEKYDGEEEWQVT